MEITRNGFLIRIIESIQKRLDVLVLNEFIYIGILGFLLLDLMFLGNSLPPPIAWLRVVLGIAFSLFIPGYVFQAALFPACSDLDSIERWAFSFLGSLVITPPIALGLSKSSWGITQWSVTTSLAAFITLCAVISLWRRKHIPMEDRYQPLLYAVHLPGSYSMLELSLRKAYLLLTGILIVVTITVIAILASPKPASRYTEFYVLGKDKMGQDYPYEAASGQAISAIFGISNFEGEPVLYRLEVRQGNTVIGNAGPLIVKNGKTVEIPLEFTPVTLEDQLEIQVSLYRDMEPTIYRHLELILQNPSSKE